MAPLIEQLRAARAQTDADSGQKAAEIAHADVPPPPFDALLLAETGGRLATLANMLGRYEVTPANVRVLGPALWAVPSVRAGAALDGAWYAAPDPAVRANRLAMLHNLLEQFRTFADFSEIVTNS